MRSIPMPSSLKFQLNPFRFLMYAEWVMLLSCGSLAALEAIEGQRLPIQHISVLVLLCLMGWMLPTGKLPLKILYTLVEVSLVFYGATLGYLHILPTLYLIVFIRSCFLFDTIGRWVVAALSLGLFLLHQIRYVQSMMTQTQSSQLEEQFWMHLIAETLMFGLGLFLVLHLVNTLLSERQVQGELTVAHEQLQQYAFQAEELAAVQERNRIARDIHDSLGHALTALNVQLQTALVVWQEQPVRAESFVQQAHRLGMMAMQELRKSLQALRENHQTEPSLAETIAVLVNDFRQGSGIETQMQSTGNKSVSPTIVRALYRIVQEALTNIYKHAQATAVAVELETTSEQVWLKIVDNGRGWDRDYANGTGFGLQGMQERVAALGGRFVLETEPGKGFRIQVEVPLRAEASVSELSSS